MSEFIYSLGPDGNVCFSQNEKKHLVMTAQVNGSTYALEFLDSVILDMRFPGRSETTRTVDTFGTYTRFESSENQLLTISEIASGIRVYNRFQISRDTFSVSLDTWAQTDAPVYDASLIAAYTKTDTADFQEIGGGDAPCFFPINPSPPTYGFRGNLVLRGENRYLQVEGGFLQHTNGIIDAHFQSGTYNDNLTYWNADNPLKTKYSFAPVPCTQGVCVAATGNMQKSGSIISGSLSMDYVNLKNGIAFLSKGTPYPMAAMLVQNVTTKTRTYLDTLSGWQNISVNTKPASTEFLLMDNGELTGIGIRLCVTSCPNNRIAWTTEAINQSEAYSILWCTYPRLYYTPDTLCDLLHPYGGGAVEIGFNRTDGFKSGNYPAGLSYSVPYYAAYPTGSRDGEGIYYAIHDPKASYKVFYTSSESQGGRIRFNCKYCAENLGAPKNGFTLPGQAIWQQFTGDWFDAVELYRQFAETCDWMMPVGENGREDIPLWMRDLPFWTMDWVPNESDAEEPIPISLRPNTEKLGQDCWFETPIKLREALGVPFGYHLYNWHKIPFNNDYPHYLPPKKAVAKGLDALKAADIRIMPYINALLWDNRDRGNTDYQFTSIAKPHTVKLESGEPNVQRYASHESDGALVKLSPMCPSSPMWREKLKEIVTGLFEEMGVDGVYLDQTAAHGPHPCMDKTHSHLPGGGCWWAQENRATLRALNAIKPADKIFTSEGNAEAYAGDLDGLLSWHWIQVDKYVPAYMRIYGGRVMVLGRNANGYMKENPLYWKYHLAQGLVAGEQMGWINSDFVYDEQRLCFARKLIRFRYENREFFRCARPMRPPVVEADESHKFACGIGMQWQGVLHEPYLCVGALENGHRKMLIAVNLAPEEISDNIWFRENELGLRADNFTCQGEGTAKYLQANRLRVTVPGESLLVLKWEVS